MNKRFTLKIGATLLVLVAMLFSQNAFAQGTCATAVTLTPGTQQCGDTSEGGDTFDDNACLGSYDGGDDYLFVVTVPAGNDGDALQLDMTSSGSWTGIAISEGCPEGGGGVCFGASTSSAGNESLTSDALTGGNTYYIHISTWPSPQTADFCLDAAYASPPAPPSNDLCSGATPITPTTSPGTCETGTNENATDSGVASPSCAGADYAGGDIWYAINVPAGETQVNYERTASAFSTTYYALYSGACGALVEEDCGTATTDQFTGLTPGSTYYLRLFDWGNNDIGDVTFCLSLPAPPPANDACTGAIELTGTVSGSTSDATNVEGLTPCTSNGGTVTGQGGSTCNAGTGTMNFGAGVWYYYTSTGPEIITISTDGSSFDTELQVFEGDCTTGLTCVDADDDGASTGSNSELCWASTASLAPVTYYIYLDGHNTASGSFVLTLAQTPLPVELISFEGYALEKENKLTWATASEENTEWHIIERSIDGQKDWTEIGKTRAAGTTAEIQRYELMDNAPVANAYYRVKSLDFDLRFEYSNVVNIQREDAPGDISVYPNPVSHDLNVDFILAKNEVVNITITDVTGKLISFESYEARRGSNNHVVNFNGLNSGIYFVSMISTSGKVTERVVKN